MIIDVSEERPVAYDVNIDFNSFAKIIVEPLWGLNYKPREVKDPNIVRLDISGDFHHQNFLEYLEIAYSRHYGVVITPHIFWYSILSELSTHIKENSEHYRHLFAKHTGKLDIIVPTSDSQLLPLNSIMGSLYELVPTNIDIFMPDFSTSTYRSKFSCMAAFCDAVSPYYNYMMYACGIPKIRLEGTKDDWEKMGKSLSELRILDKAIPYLDVIKNLVQEITYSFDHPNPCLWKNMFFIQNCGSGHQEVVCGWASKLFLKVPRPAYVRNFSSQIANVEYKNITTNENFKLYSGLFSSKIDGDFLVPDFGYFVEKL